MLTRDLKIIYLSIFTQGFGYGLYFYLAPLYARSLGATPVQVGLIYTTFYLFSALVAIPGGLMADRYSLKRVISFIWIAIIPAGFFYLIARSWHYLLFANIFAGISMMNSPAMAVYIAKKAKRGFLARAYTLVYSSFAAGMILSPGLGGFIAQQVDFQTVFFISTILFIISSGVIFLISDEKPVSKKGEKKIFHLLQKRGFVITLGYFTFIFFVIFISQPFLTPFLRETRGFALATIGILGAFSSLGASIIGPVMGHLADVYSQKTAMLGGLGAMMAGVVLLLISPALASVFAAFLLFGVVEGFYNLSGAVISKQIEELPAGLAFGFFRFITLGVSFLGPYAGGVLYEINTSIPFAVTGLTLLALFLFTTVGPVFKAKGKDLVRVLGRRARAT